MKTIYLTLNDSSLMERINSAKHSVSLTAPGVNMDIAVALNDAVERLDGNVHLLIDKSPESYRLGFNDPDAIRFLQKCIQKHGLDSFRCEKGIRMGVLNVDDEVLYFLPESVLMEELSDDFYNSAYTDETEQGVPIGKTNLSEMWVPNMEQLEEIKTPQTKEEQLQAENSELKQENEKLRKEIKNLEKEKGKLPIQENLKFVDIEGSQYRLNMLKIKVPGKFMTDRNDVSARMESKYLVLDAAESLDEQVEISINGKKKLYKISNFSKEIDDLRKNYTVMLGKWKRAILSTKKEAFEAECENLSRLSFSIKEALTEKIKTKIDKRVDELFQTLRSNIEAQFKKEYSLDVSPSDKDLLLYFRKEMYEEIEKAQLFFDPQIKYVFKELSREDAESVQFCEIIRKTLPYSADLFKDVLKERTFLYFDEELLRVSEEGKKSVVIIANPNNYPNNQWELMRGIQRLWKRMIEFVSDKEKNEFESNLNLLLLTHDKSSKVKIGDLSYLDLLDRDIVSSGAMGKAAKFFLDTIPSCKDFWTYYPLLYPNSNENRNPKKFSQILLKDTIDYLDGIGRDLYYFYMFSSQNKDEE